MSTLRAENHPYNTASWFSKINFNWVSPKIKAASRGGFTQEMHYPLQPDIDIRKAAPEFERDFKEASSLFSLMFKAFGPKTFLATLTVIRVILEFSEIWIVYSMTQSVKGITPTQPLDRRVLAAYFGAILAVQYFHQLIETIVMFQMYNRLVRVKNCFITQIIKQVFRVNVQGNDGVSKGNVLNLIQVDCENIEAEGIYIFLFLYNFLILVGCFGCGFFLLGRAFLVYVAVNIAIASLTAFLYSRSTYYTEKLMQFRDDKMTLLSSLFSNIRFVKFNVMEDFFARVASIFRRKEMRQLRSSFVIIVFVTFFDWLNPSLSMVCLYWTYLVLYRLINMEVYLASQQLAGKIYQAFSTFPAILSLIFKFVVMFKRMRQFFDIKENDTAFLEHKFTAEDVSIHVRDAVFSHQNQDQSLFNQMCEELNEEKPGDPKEAEVNKDFRLKIDDLMIKKGELVFVIGRIGAGKSSLVGALLGELSAVTPETSVKINGRVTYCSQQPFLMTKSVQENIVFYRPFDQQRLNLAMDMASLVDDLASWPDRDHKELSEGGMNVSGGQRSRINMARCFYGDADIYLFDDPFSALDVNVSSKIIEEAIVKQLAGKTRVVITHSIQYLKYAHAIIYLDAGQVAFKGTFDTFKESPLYHGLRGTIVGAAGKAAKDLKSLKRRASLGDSMIGRKTDLSLQRQPTRVEISSMIGNNATKFLAMSSLERSGRQLGLFFRLLNRYYGGPIVFIFLTALIAVSYYSYYYSGVYLVKFIELQDDNIWTIHKVMTNVGLMLILPNFLLLIRGGIEASICMAASRFLHKAMLIRSLHADILSFYDQIETGQLLNRFSKDMATIDGSLPQNLSSFVVGFAFVIIDLIVLSKNFTAFIWVLFGLYGVVLLWYQSIYLNVNKDVVRLDAVTKAPILNLVSEIVDGREVINIFHAKNDVLHEMTDRINNNAKNVLFKRALQAWFNTRVTLYNLGIVQIVVMGYCLVNIHQLENPYTFVLSITFLMSAITNIKYALDLFAEVELDFVAVERCDSFLNVPIEKNYLNFKEEAAAVSREMERDRLELHQYLRIKDPNPNDNAFDLETINQRDFRTSIFTRGVIQFSNVSARYPSSDTLCLKEISFRVDAGKKLGIVGKTGSGKSTIIKLLTRALKEREGSVTVDGYDISGFDLKQLRSEMLIINQEIALFEGTIFENMCPEHAGKPEDRDLVIAEVESGVIMTREDLSLSQPLLEHVPRQDGRAALEAEITDCLVRFGFSKDKLAEKGLDFKIETGGANLSPGEQQLIAIFRALFTDKKIIILDEATASIDYETEKNIIDYFFKRIRNKTLISIAHRLNTVVGCDQILVLSQGRIIESGSPASLIQNENSIFGKMYRKANSGWEFDE